MKRIFETLWKATCLSGLAVLWFLTFFYPNFAQAFVANDMGDGIYELTTSTDEGFVVQSVARLQSKNEDVPYVFFCVAHTNGGRSQRCFYGKEDEFREIQLGLKMLGLQYLAIDKVSNRDQEILIGNGRPFYPVVVIRPAAQ